MTIWLYCICRNESKILPYLLRHYVPWVDKLIFYDDQSDDGTRDLIRACNRAELREWPGSHAIVDDEFTSFANEQWKEARGYAEWVIWIDADEFLYHHNIRELLKQYLDEGVEVPQIEGYTMVARDFPVTSGKITDEIRTGFRDGVWDKKAVFRAGIWYNVGRHSINFDVFNPKSSKSADIKLLHYRCLGMDYLRWRHARNWNRVPEHCRRANYGNNTSPDWTDHHGIAWFQDALAKYGDNQVI